jgi:hypothetical protein
LFGHFPGTSDFEGSMYPESHLKPGEDGRSHKISERRRFK